MRGNVPGREVGYANVARRRIRGQPPSVHRGGDSTTYIQFVMSSHVSSKVMALGDARARIHWHTIVVTAPASGADNAIGTLMSKGHMEKGVMVLWLPSSRHELQYVSRYTRAP
jgi:hypothetical protein